MRKVIGILCIVAGIGVFFYPELSTWRLDRETDEFVKIFEKTNPKTEKEADVRYKECLAYNQEIYERGQRKFKDAWNGTQIPASLKEFPDGKIGYVKIPKMDVKLTLYLGASENNLSKGAAVLGGTSIPAGGENTNSVIAGHRGYRGIPFFREIEKLKTGDKVIIRNPWEKLSYRVADIQVIDPYDTDAIKIQEGKDMVSLITCHPYRGHGKQRYVVYCIREDGNPKKGKMEDMHTTQITMTQAAVSSQGEIDREKRFRAACGVFISLISARTLLGRKKGKRDEENE